MTFFPPYPTFEISVLSWPRARVASLTLSFLTSLSLARSAFTFSGGAVSGKRFALERVPPKALSARRLNAKSVDASEVTSAEVVEVRAWLGPACLRLRAQRPGASTALPS